MNELEEMLSLHEEILARYKQNCGSGGPAEANYYHQLKKVEDIRAEIKALKDSFAQANG